jgi:CheY-like chemotaxis protein
MMEALLAMYGHTVLVAHSAETALTLSQQAAVDVALLDIGLPGMNGYELARHLRAQDSTGNLRLVAVTGWGQEADKARARAAGFDAHLTKPAEPDVVLSIL